MIEVWFNGRFHFEVDDNTTAEALRDKYVRDLIGDGYPVGEHEPLEVVKVDGRFEVWYE